MFVRECEKVTNEITRFTSHERFEYNLAQVKKGGKPNETLILGTLVAVKLGWWGYKLCAAVSGSSSDNSDDKWIDNSFNSTFGLDNCNLDEFDKLVDANSGIDPNIYPTIEFGDNTTGGIESFDFNDSDIEPIDTDINIEVQDALNIPEPTDNGINENINTNFTFEPQPISYDQQPDGTVIVRDMFGMEHQWPSMEMAQQNTDFLSGIPSWDFSSMPQSNTDNSSSWSPLPTDTHTEPDLSFYDNQIDDADKQYNEYSEKFLEAEKNNNLKDMEFYQSKAKEAQDSKLYWKDCRQSSYFDQTEMNIKTDFLNNQCNKALNELHETLHGK